jgi:hypothetical protein
LPTFIEPPGVPGGSDSTAPSVLITSPANQATGVAIGSDILVTFSEAVQRGTGNIVVKTSAGATVATYDAATSSNLSISGNTLTINPSKDLGIYTGYKIEIDAGAIKDWAGNSYLGLNSYSFSTQTLDSFYHFFVVAFAAAPGVEYMNQLAEAYNFGLGVQDIVNIFTTKSEFTSTYPVALTHAQLASSLVNNIVKNSASDTVKAQAVADITDALNIGWSIGRMIYQVFGNLATKPLTDTDWGNTALQFQNELAVARYYTEVMWQNSTDLPTLRAVIGSVDNHTDVSTPDLIATLIGVELSHIV